MNTLKKYVSSLALMASLSFALVPAFAAAATLGVSADGSTGVNVGADGSADARTSGSAGGNSTTSSTGSGSSGAGASGSVSGRAGVSLDLSQDDAAETDGSATISNAAQVASDADLRAYAAQQMKADANFEAVSATDDTLVVKHAMPARLFGVFKVNITTTTTVKADGTVTVSYPWYSFFFKTDDRASLETDLKSRMRTTLGASASDEVSASTGSNASVTGRNNMSATGTNASAGAQGNANANARISASQKARLIEHLQAVFAARGAVDAAASGSASGNTNDSSR